MKENLIKGSYIGLVLLISSILMLRFTNDIESATVIFNYFIPVLVGYIIIGVCVQLLKNLPSKSTGGIFGFGIYYILCIGVFFIPEVGAFFPDYIRFIILTNIIVIIGFEIIDYINISKIAKELNSEKSCKKKVLVIDLEEKPKTKEEFFKVLEEKCISKGDTLEYIERDIPAIIKLNGVLYRAEIGYYYGLAGINVCNLKLTSF